MDEGNVVSVPFTFFVQDRKFCVLLSFPVSRARCCPDMVWITVDSTAMLIQVSVMSINGRVHLSSANRTLDSSSPPFLSFLHLCSLGVSFLNNYP